MSMSSNNFPDASKILAKIKQKTDEQAGIRSTDNPWSMGHISRKHVLTTQLGMTAEEIRENERMWQEEEVAYRHRIEEEEISHRERMDALKTFYPRAHNHIPNLDDMIDIARENQLNPLYESVLKEFDEAKLAMSRATNKLASAVKLTDSEALEARSRGGSDIDALWKLKLNSQYGSLNSAYPGTITGPMGATGPMGVPGMPGPKGDKGDKGEPGPPGSFFGSLSKALGWFKFKSR